MVGRVREALKQVTDLKVVRRNLLAKMAARVLEISEDEVLRLIDGGHT